MVSPPGTYSPTDGRPQQVGIPKIHKNCIVPVIPPYVLTLCTQ